MPANCLAQVTALSESGATDLNAGVILRAADSNNYYLASMGLVGGKGASIFKKVAGAYTRIAYDANLTPVAGDVIRLEASGTTLTMKRNGTTLLTAVDASLIAGGAVGVRGAGIATTSFDNFGADAL